MSANIGCHSLPNGVILFDGSKMCRPLTAISGLESVEEGKWKIDKCRKKEGSWQRLVSCEKLLRLDNTESIFFVSALKALPLLLLV
jgi:hypothetical protein